MIIVTIVRAEKPVTPGDIIGVEEEYIPGDGAYVDENGYIRSLMTGRAVMDRISKIVNVKHVKNKPIIPRQGDIVIGIVEGVSNDLAFIDIISVEKSSGVKKTDFSGIIHISQASREYLESMYDAYRIGDIIRARVLNNTNPYQLSTREPSMGVITAFCTKCGSILKKSDDRLICPTCGNVEKRKISVIYSFR